MGAGLAFQAALDRYSRKELVLLNYHVHIPQPDPMVNPSTLAREKFYDVTSSPSYLFDGERDGGGGSADGARQLLETKIDPILAKHMDVPPEAAIALKASAAGSTVKVAASVSKVTSKSEKLKVQIALVENRVNYSGENGMRIHEMVVRSLAVPPAPKPAKADPKAEAPKPGAPPETTGFALKPGSGGTFEYTFDLVKAVADARAHLEDFEANSPGSRWGKYAFRKKMNDIDGKTLSVVAFVQDETTMKILQAVYVKLPTR